MHPTFRRSAAAIISSLALAASTLVAATPAQAEVPNSIEMRVTQTAQGPKFYAANHTGKNFTNCWIAIHDDQLREVRVFNESAPFPNGTVWDTWASDGLDKGYYTWRILCGETTWGDPQGMGWVPFTVGSRTFSDVAPSAQFHNEISWMAAEDLANGWNDGTFRPVQPVARDAMAAFLYRFAGSPRYTPPAKSPFADVSPTQEHYKEIAWMYSRGLATGWVENGVRLYRPSEPVNRDAMAAFLFRYEDPQHLPQDRQYFSDVPTTAEFAVAIAWMKENRFAEGYADGTFRPTTPVNRDAMAAFLYRLNWQRSSFMISDGSEDWMHPAMSTWYNAEKYRK